MKQLFAVYQTELIKTKHSFALWLTVLGAGFMPSFILFVYLSEWEQIAAQAKGNPWDELFEMAWKGMGFFFTPFLVVLLICLIFNLDHRANTWKLLFTLPVPKGAIYGAKLLTLMTAILVFYGLYIPFLLLSGLVAGMLFPALGLLSHMPNIGELIVVAGRSFIALQAVLALHFWLSIRLKNMIIPIGFALVSNIVFVALFQGQWPYIIYYPYAFNYLSVAPPPFLGDYATSGAQASLAPHEYCSLLMFLVITCFSYLDFTRRYKG